MVSLTLLRSPRCPDEKADIGRHQFTYALLPHAHAFSVETVVREAYALNVPLTVTPHTADTGQAHGLDCCRVSNPQVIVEAVKKAEEDHAIIVRLYEAGNTRGDVVVSFGRPVKKVYECTLMEETGEGLKVRGDDVEFTIAPFEIKTLKVYFR